MVYKFLQVTESNKFWAIDNDNHGLLLEKLYSCVRTKAIIPVKELLGEYQNLLVTMHPCIMHPCTMHPCTMHLHLMCLIVGE